jgi:hypothetical protein
MSIQLTPTPGSEGLRGYGYDPASQTLAVEFQSNHEEATYHYLDVPPETAAAMEVAKSKTAFVMKNVKPHFQFERVPKG